MKKYSFSIILITVMIGLTIPVSAQVTVNSDGSVPDPSAMLDVKSTNSGFLFPRLTQTERNAIPSPATGLLIYNTTSNLFNYYNGTYWYQIEATFLSFTTGGVRPGGGISINESSSILADSSAMLDVNNSARGVLIPRTTTGSITSPTAGLIIFNATSNSLNYYDGNQWITLCGVSTGISGGTGSQEPIGISINTDGSLPHQSAILDVTSLSKGMLIPRMSESQRNSILPVVGLTIYNTSAHTIEFFNGSGWYKLNIFLNSAPVSGTSIAYQTQIIWNWNALTGATGYKWNTTNDFSTAIDMGSGISKSETGLTCNTSYTRYVWAYNGCGQSGPSVLTQTTSFCPYPCGTPITINHIEGNVAPVNKTVTYGTVSNIPGEPTKCWITSNLGADHQATGPNDATEESAGWYWQFDRKQGYKHDGSTRTPNTNWISGINEQSDWVDDNDPCQIELGVGWRIPTITEWINVLASGGWTNSNDTWNSSLKLHAAGVLSYQNGAITTRGLEGYLNSSSQANIRNQWFIILTSNGVFIRNGFENYSLIKSFGMSCRCVNDSCSPPKPPSQGTHIQSKTQIIWNWGLSAGATGYKWNTVNKYDSAVNLGTSTSMIETNLICNTPYIRYVWAYNDCGYSIATVLIQSTLPCTGEPAPCPGLSSLSYEGQNYRTVKIGYQCWMKENLNVGFRIDTTINQTNNAIIEKYCYSEDESLCNEYGGLYLWDEMMNYTPASNANPSGRQGICPSGWHLPSDDEWCQLAKFFAPSFNCNVNGQNTTGYIGYKLREKSILHWFPPNTWANNSSQFTALPGGYFKHNPSSFNLINIYGYFWSCSENSSTNAYSRSLVYSEPGIFRNSSAKNSLAFSVRCIKDICDPPPTPTQGNHTSTTGKINWKWNSVAGAIGYQLGVTNDFTTGIDLGPDTTYMETGLTCNTAYFRYVWAYSTCGASTPVVLSSSTLADPPPPPAQGVNVPSITQIIWNWNTVTSATGYKWNITNDYSTAIDMGTETTKTETALACNTAYTRFVWAYSPCGVCTPVTLTMSTLTDSPSTPAAGTNVPSITQIIWNWNTVSGATGYKWNMTNDYATATDMGTATTKAETALTCNTAYTRYVWAYNTCKNSTPLTLTMATLTDPPTSPSAGTHVPLITQITWNWSTVLGATGYKWNNTNNYVTATDMGTETSKTETNLLCNSVYSSYVWVYGPCGYSDPTMLTTATLPDPPAQPNTGTHVPSSNQIVWNWYSVPGAAGYKWNTTNNCSSAIDMGTDTVKTEYGLLCNTSYLRYIWTYNNCGNSNAVILTQSTSICPFICGDSITIIHIADTVAPVNKTVTYGTATNIPSELSKCWITSNLGADHQADSVKDPTEASAGWYWQFNRKQGYKHDGTTRTPNNTWINSIAESSDWIASNDPCNLELGYGWHIPTRTEWTNVFINAGWTNWNGPWNSDLKIHAAGYLDWNSGALVDRGTSGLYWTNKVYSGTNSFYLYSLSSGCAVSITKKTYGLPIRCVSGNCDPPSPALAGSHIPSATQIIWNWNAVSGATGYKWNTTYDYSTAQDMGTVTTKTETGLNCNTSYIRYVWAYSGCGYSLGSQLSKSTLPGSSSPTAGTHVPSMTKIIWNWNPVAGALGYKWNTTNNYSTAIDMGTNTSKTETGLTCGNAYTRYVWAYTECGSSSATLLQQNTLINPPVPTSGSHVTTPYYIIWKWLSIPDVTGYKWNTTNDYSTAIDMSTDTAKTEYGLKCNTIYTRYVWAYWQCGYSGNVLTQSTASCPANCPSPLIDSRDGISYNTVLIGNQCWMQQNLNYSTPETDCYEYADAGDKRCLYDNISNCDVLGGLYFWERAMNYSTIPNSTGICPNGWHIPDTNDWNQLITYLGGPNVAGTKMVALSYGGSNESGFTALPGRSWKKGWVPGYPGGCSFSGCESVYGSNYHFWTSDGISNSAAREVKISDNLVISYDWAYYDNVPYGTGCYQSEYYRPYISYSVRCIKGCNSPATPLPGSHFPSETFIIWNWNPVSEATGYKWNTTNNYSTAIDMGTSTTKIETGLTCNTAYIRYVWAYSADCGASNVTSLSASTSVNNPTAPITGTHTPSSAQIIWNWNPVSGATGYKWNTINNYTTAIDNGASTSKTETGLFCSTNYIRYVWAYNSCINSAGTILTQSTTIEPPVPPISGAHSPSLTQIIWNWNTVPGATGYKWNTTNNYTTATDMGTGTTKTETGLTCYTNYTRFVWAYSACGNSNSTSLTQMTLLPAPAVGTNIPSVNQIIWNWNVVPGALGYKWNVINDYSTAIDIGTSTSKTETGLSCNTTYTRFVWAYCTCGYSIATTLTQATSLNPPSSPVAGTHVPSVTQIIWNWNPVSGATGYKWNTTNNYSTATDMGTSTTKTETGLTCNTVYTRYIWAYNNCGNSPQTSLAQSTSVNPPSAPLEGTHIPSSAQIVWNWNTVSGATGYKWNSTNNYSTAIDMGTSTSKTETGLICNTAYTRYAWAYSSCGNSSATTLTKSTTLNPPSSPAAGTHVPSVTQIIWNWNPVSGATGYKWNTTNNYSTATDMGTSTAKTETGLTCNTAYTRYVWAYSSCGNSSSTPLTQSTTLNPPSSPVAGAPVPSETQIIWNWNPVSGATGYKWNTTNNYSTSIDMGTSTSKTETGLTCNTAYTRYVWAYSNCGVSSPSTLSSSTSECPWTCGQPFTDTRNGKTYNTVLITGYCWMAENINIGSRINGSQAQSNNSTIEKYCYNDLESNCNTYGGLYQGDEAVQYSSVQGTQGICPNGWHIPDDQDWTVLINYLGGLDVAGGKMKETGTSHWLSPNTGATNSSGFTGLPGGDRMPSGLFENISSYGHFWSSTHSADYFYWSYYLYYGIDNAYRIGELRESGYSVRCLKD